MFNYYYNKLSKSVNLGTKLFSIVALMSVSIPFVSTQILAESLCNQKLQSKIQKNINLLADLEAAPTPKEQANNTKVKFLDNKKNIKNENYKKLEAKLIEETTRKYTLQGFAQVKEDYIVQFSNGSTKDELKAIVTQLKEYDDGMVNSTMFEYDVDTKTDEVKEVDWKKSTKKTKEESELISKLSLQNDSKDGTKVNNIGQTDEDVKKLIELKNYNSKSIPPITKFENPNKEFLKDNRESFRKQKEDLIAQKKNVNCKEIKAKATLYSTYNATNAVTYAKYYANKRNPNFADFKNVGGNCTNFASQAIQAGGYQDDYNFYSEIIGVDEQYNYGQTNDGPYTNFNSNKSFYVNPAFNHVTYNKAYIWNLTNTSNYYFYNAQKSNGQYYKYYGNNFPSLWNNMFDNTIPGDIVWADWENDGTWDHSMIITGKYFDWGALKYLPILSYNDRDEVGIEFRLLNTNNKNFVTIHL